MPPLDRGELAALIEGIEGERTSASLLLLVAERSGGSPLVAEELLAARRELPTASLSGSLDELVVGRLGIRSVECRRVLRLLAPAGRMIGPGAAGPDRGRLRDRHVAAGAAVDQLAAPRRRDPRRGHDGRARRGRRARVPRRARRRRRVPPRADRHGRGAGPAPARPDAPPRLAGGGPRPTCRPRPPGTGSRPTTRPPRDVPPIEAADLAAARHAAADELDALELALSLERPRRDRAAPPRGGVTTSAARTGPTSRSGRPRPRSRSGGRRGRRPTSRRRSGRSTPGATGSASGCSTSASAWSGARRATRSGHGPRRGAPSS